MLHRICFFMLLCISPLSYAYQAEVVRVVDGDTIVIKAPWLLPELGDTIPIRVSGVDTPEKGRFAKCDLERQLAQAATEFTKSIISPGDIVTVHVDGRDKYFRILGTIFVGTRSLSSMLVENNYAVSYAGLTKKNWCM